jgi:hypothetical protein
VDAFRAGYKQRYVALVGFDLGPIPAGASVGAAFLQLYAKGWGGTDTVLNAYRLTRPVNMCQANWNQAASGTPWGSPGGNDTATDRGAAEESSVTTDSIWRWYTFDLTALVQDWTEGRQANNGVLIRNASSLSEGMFYFCSVEDAAPSKRPKLVVTYTSADGPVSTRTATSTPGGPTPTPTQVLPPVLAIAPYVGQTTSNSVAVSWATNNATTCELRFSRDASYASRAVASRSAAGGYYWHSATATSLLPGNSYNYRVFCGGIDLTPWPQASFSAAPSTGTSTFRFAVLGDSRPDSAGALPRPGARAIAAQMARKSFDLVLHTGDLVYSGGACDGVDNSWSQYARAYFGLYQETIGNVPWYLSIGNHELDGGSCGYSSYRGMYQLPTNAPEGAEEQYYSFNWGAVHFIALDTSQSLHRGSPQYMWLLDDLKTSPQEWKFVFFHLPAYSSGIHGSDALLQEKLPPLFELYGVDAVFSGHDHDYERTCSILQGACVDPAQGGVVYYVTGGGGAPAYPAGSDWFTAYGSGVNHFLLVEVDGCRLRIDATDANGNIFDTVELNRCS